MNFLGAIFSYTFAVVGSSSSRMMSVRLTKNNLCVFMVMNKHPPLFPLLLHSSVDQMCKAYEILTKHKFFSDFLVSCDVTPQHSQTSTTSGGPVCAGWVRRGWRWELQAEHEREAGPLQQTVPAWEGGSRACWRAPRETKAKGGSVPHAAHHCGGGQSGG